MPRGLDHIVHAVRDLDAAAALYRRLGFTVGARNRHPWGTHNHIVQLPGFFLELLTVAEPEKLGSEGFSALFGTFNRLFLKRHEGLSFMMLESADALQDAADFRAAKIAASDALVKVGGTITLRATVLSAVPALCSADKMVNSIFANKVLS